MKTINMPDINSYQPSLNKQDIKFHVMLLSIELTRQIPFHPQQQPLDQHPE
jgi:hypothetical protein